MSVTATGIFKQPSMLATLVSYSSTWQSVCSASSAADALRFVHSPLLDVTDTEDDDTTRYPRAVIGWQDSDSFSRTKQGVQHWVTTGSLTLAIELQVPPDYGDKSNAAHNWFMNKVGLIITEMEALAGTGEPITGETHLNATAFNRVDGPWELDEDEIEIMDPDNYEQLHIMWIVFNVEYV